MTAQTQPEALQMAIRSMIQEAARQRARIAELEVELMREAQRTAAEKLRADQMTEQHRQQAAMNAEARSELARIVAEKASLRDALLAIASGEIMRSHCTGPHCTEELGVATADEMASRAAGALDWDDRVAEPPTQLREKLQSLSDEQIDAALQAWFGNLGDSTEYRCRMRGAIEAAHNITGEPT